MLTKSERIINSPFGYLDRFSFWLLSGHFKHLREQILWIRFIFALLFINVYFLEIILLAFSHADYLFGKFIFQLLLSLLLLVLFVERLEINFMYVHSISQFFHEFHDEAVVSRTFYKIC